MQSGVLVLSLGDKEGTERSKTTGRKSERAAG